MKVILVEKAILLHLYGPCVRACWRLSYIWLFAALWTVDHQTSLSKGFPGMNTGVGCQAFLQKIFSTQELNFHLLCLLWTLISYVSCLQVDSLPLMPPGKPIHTLLVKKKKICSVLTDDTSWDIILIWKTIARHCFLLSIEFQFFKMKKVLEIGCTIMWMYLVLLTCMLKNS